MTGLGGSLIGSVGRWLDRGINRLMGAETPAPSDGSLSDDEGVRLAGLHRKTGSVIGGSSTVRPGFDINDCHVTAGVSLRFVIMDCRGHANSLCHGQVSSLYTSSGLPGMTCTS